MLFSQNVKCKIGIHNWNKWEYSEKSSCREKRQCANCKKIQWREFHNWDDRNYRSEEDTEAWRSGLMSDSSYFFKSGIHGVCKRCGKIKWK